MVPSEVSSIVSVVSVSVPVEDSVSVLGEVVPVSLLAEVDEFVVDADVDVVSPELAVPAGSPPHAENRNTAAIARV